VAIVTNTAARATHAIQQSTAYSASERRDPKEVCFNRKALEVCMRVDLYTKAVLTVIAAALVGLLVNAVSKPSVVAAQSGTDYSRLEVAASGNQLVIYDNLDGTINVLDLNSGRHLRSWRLGDPTVNLASGN
jgi:hypothetical protein